MMANSQLTDVKSAGEDPALSAFLRFVEATSPGDDELLQACKEVASEEILRMGWGEMLNIAAVRLAREIDTKEDETEFTSLGFSEFD